jgi:predicted flavoprotein YhiN
MDLSHHIGRQSGSNLHLELNLLMENEGLLRSLLSEKRHVSISTLLESVLPPKVAAFLVDFSGLPETSTCREMNRSELDRLFQRLTHLPIAVRGVRGFEYCQLKAGGVPVNEVDATSMQSLLIPHLFLAGETLDMVGPCGGYNLHFAFSSGLLAGQGAAMA